MQRCVAVGLGLAVLLVPLPAPVLAAGAVPTQVGQCVATQITEKFSRLEGVPDSGSGIRYANGIVGVSYDTLRPVTKAKVGDNITLCLISIPKGCPPGDDRGRIYLARDLTTGSKWELADAEHMCGRA
jgi:hypothetical protein